MSLLNRRFLFAVPLLALAACGFQPVYGPGGSGTALQNAVQVDAPDDAFSYTLVREIETRLGRADSPRYALALTVDTSQEGLAIDSEDNTTRYNLVGDVDFALRNISTGQVVTSGNVENFTGYSATGSTVATLAAERDAQKRLMVMLAEQLVTRLYAADLAQ
ncbi:LPS assembly lipoprotein LptE [Sulfitobacter litoralis]|uniref:LPS assembly lipoprotein LptE n=1 Tax=Sulfitobacter litoralis TaxID=335975 RepID=UPI002B272D01|nr:LPS assembly lipoprotein LptE [Sulfitobacter litoralis]